MMDFGVARHNMVESQVRPNGITDYRIIAAMASVPRELFVPEHRRALAYMDEDVLVTAPDSRPPRYLMEPMAFARLVQLAQIGPSDVVLDVGCGTGYSTAVLSHIAQSVVAVEENAELAHHAQKALEKLGIGNVAVVQGPLSGGWRAEAPFQVILLNGRIGYLPDPLLAQLADGGRLVAVTGSGDMAPAILVARHGQALSRRPAFDASVAPLPGFSTPQPSFAF